MHISNIHTLTPIEKHEGIFVKRDDYFSIGGACGGKARTCWVLAKNAKGLVAVANRHSPQINRVARIANILGIPCRGHTASGPLTPELLMAKSLGATIIQHKPGYNSVIIKRAKDDAKKNNFTEIPFGVECQEAVNQTMPQVENIPNNTKRIVLPVGSGMSLAGVLQGLIKFNKKIPVLGISVGADPTKRLDTYAPKNWRKMCTIIKSKLSFETEAKEIQLGPIFLDPIYEAKCLEFLEKEDLLWIIGVRESLLEEINAMKQFERL